MALGETLASEWQTVSQAPHLYGAVLVSALVAATAGIWAIMNWVYGNRIENLESRNKLLSATIDDYKRKLEVQSPQEAEDKLLSLESRVQLLELTTETDADAFYRRMFEAAKEGKDVFIGGKPLED